MHDIPFSIFKRKWRGAEAEEEGRRWQTQTVCTPGHWKLRRGFWRKGHFPRQKKGKKKKNGITALCLSLHRQVGKGFWKSSSLPLSRVHTQSPARPGVAGSVSPMPGTGHVTVKPRPTPTPRGGGCGVLKQILILAGSRVPGCLLRSCLCNFSRGDEESQCL